jgi:hypothetical protein
MTEEPVDIDVYRVSKAFIRMWEDSFSDNGAIWAQSQQALEELRTTLPEEVVREGFKLASKRWHSHD